MIIGSRVLDEIKVTRNMYFTILPNFTFYYFKKNNFLYKEASKSYLFEERSLMDRPICGANLSDDIFRSYCIVSTDANVIWSRVDDTLYILSKDIPSIYV